MAKIKKPNIPNFYAKMKPIKIKRVKVKPLKLPKIKVRKVKYK